MHRLRREVNGIDVEQGTLEEAIQICARYEAGLKGINGDLGDAFSQATEAISSERRGEPIAGFESYREIAVNVNEMSGFHNSTTVLLAFPA